MPVSWGLDPHGGRQEVVVRRDVDEHLARRPDAFARAPVVSRCGDRPGEAEDLGFDLGDVAKEVAISPSRAVRADWNENAQSHD